MLDAWAIELTNIVAAIGGQTISRCYVESAVQDDSFCHLLLEQRNGAFKKLEHHQVNAAINNVEGIDFGIDMI